MQARLAQCYFLLSQSRVNHCWSLFGTMAHLALAIGLNRNRRPDATLNRVECECRSRTFWCAYTLDRYLSAALGRPRTFHDEDIDTELPSCVDDQDLLLAEQPPAGLDIPKSHSIMLAPIAHVK